MTSKRKVIWVAAFILIMAVAIVLCVELFGATRETRYDGTLVQSGMDCMTLNDTSLLYIVDIG